MVKVPTVTRDYNEWAADTFRGTLTKMSKTQRLSDEIEYYKHLPAEFQIWFPRLVEWGHSPDGGYMTLEQYPYKNLGEYYTGHHRLTMREWSAVLDKLYKVIQMWREYTVPQHVQNLCTPDYLHAMYETKTRKEYEAFVKQGSKYNLFGSDVVTYQGVEYANFQSLWSDIKTSQFLMTLFHGSLTLGHGDFCFSNILYGSHNDGDPILKFIDPRGSFGYEFYSIPGPWGDPRYDVAKLSHSVHGQYEILNNDEFYLMEDGESSWRTLGYRNRKRQIETTFNSIFFGPDKYSKKEIRFIEGLIFVGACARHYESPDRQAALYLKGIKALNEALDMEE